MKVLKWSWLWRIDPRNQEKRWGRFHSDFGQEKTAVKERAWVISQWEDLVY